MDMGTGRVLYEQNADEPIPPASLTKVLTMYMALERVQAGEVSLDAPVRVSRAAARTGGSRMSLRPQEWLPLESLLMGMAVSSGNDASAAVAEYLGGSQEAFVAQMNATAAALGMSSSRFYNPHGLPAAGQVTTARDMLRLSFSYLRAHPDALRYHSTRFIRHNGVVSYNKNPLLGNCEGADGLKTGWVNASGYNLISTVRRGDTRLLAVILGAENSKTRAREVYRLMEAGFVSTSARQRSVADVLPTLPPAAYSLTLSKTIHDAYATLAPEELARSAKASKASKAKVQKKRDKASVQKAHARKSPKSATAHKHRKRQTPATESGQASLRRSKG